MSIINPFVHEFCIDLQNGTTQQREKKPLSQGDAYADKIVVHVQDGGNEVSLAGVGVSAKVIRYDGQTVPIVGHVEDGAACVVLDAACYAKPGDVRVSVALSVGEMVQTVLVLSMSVETSETSIIADNGVVSDLTEILTSLADMSAATDAANNAAERANSAAQRAEDAAERAESAGGGGGGAALTVDPDGNAVIRGGDASPEEVQGAVDAALEAAKASGEFKGDPGKTAYQYAKEGGYTGTEAQFAQKLAAEIPAPYVLPVATADTLGGVRVGEGLLMDGDVLGVKPEPEFELIETIVCDGTYGNARITELALTHAEIYINAKGAESAANLVAEISNATGIMGYAVIGSGINTSERWSYIYAVSDGKNAYMEHTAAATSDHNTGALNRTPGKQDASTHISRVAIYAGSSKMLPAGTTIEIWGVRA